MSKLTSGFDPSMANSAKHHAVKMRALAALVRERNANVQEIERKMRTSPDFTREGAARQVKQLREQHRKQVDGLISRELSAADELLLARPHYTREHYLAGATFENNLAELLARTRCRDSATGDLGALLEASKGDAASLRVLRGEARRRAEGGDDRARHLQLDIDAALAAFPLPAHITEGATALEELSRTRGYVQLALDALRDGGDDPSMRRESQDRWAQTPHNGPLVSTRSGELVAAS